MTSASISRGVLEPISICCSPTSQEYPSASIGRFVESLISEAGPRRSARAATCALPVVVERNAPLIFRLWRTGEPPGVWNIPIPVNSPELVPDVVIAPVVGFDEQGYRLGYGGGILSRSRHCDDISASPRRSDGYDRHRRSNHPTISELMPGHSPRVPDSWKNLPGQRIRTTCPNDAHRRPLSLSAQSSTSIACSVERSHRWLACYDGNLSATSASKTQFETHPKSP